jgi:SAM-dependent methyltransferase
MTPQDFIAKWGPGGPAYELNERQGAQPHFIDLCQLLGVPTPGSTGDYLFEQDTLVLGEARGYADVFMRNHFAWENKAPGRNLDTALKQLLTYSLALSNPPLLVVCDRLTIRIHTQFNGHPSEVHTVLLHELAQPEKQALLRRLWLDPESFRPHKTSRDITEAAAKSFATLADGLRRRGPDRDTDPRGWQAHADEVAHFLTQCLFCFFAEDVGLLPGRMFEGLVNNKALTSDKLTQGLTNLFTVMRDGGLYGNDDIPWFNGGLFKKVNVPALSIMEMTELRNAAALNWSAIDVSIFGTLFERGLDPAKRSQLGAHYTDPATILRIVEPVLSRPLLQQWELVLKELQGLLAKSTKKGDKHYRAARERFVLWLEQLRDYRVLDPACGSGNFLFLGLKALKDIEHKSHLDAAALGLDREADLVTGPHNVLGIELNEYAAELARVTVWIGELQWRIEHGYEFKTNPVLEPLDHIECRDALLHWGSDPDFRDSEARVGRTPGAHTLRSLKSPPTSAPPTPLRDLGTPVEAQWPKASVVIGNPPFLGDKKMRTELGDAYTEALRKTYEGRVPGGADLVCYWFEKARTAIEKNGLGAAGLVATNSIRQAANRKVLDRVCETTRIFDAWSDEPWVNDGAAVRVSLISQGYGQCCFLNGQRVEQINSDLRDGSTGLDLTLARSLSANQNASFFGLSLAGPFTIDASTARIWLRGGGNPNGRPNSDVIRPIWNGADVTRRTSDRWVIDFALMDEAQSCLYEAPFEHALRMVKPLRDNNRREARARQWWRHGEARPAMREAIGQRSRFIVTSETSKHRYFVWCPASVAPEHKLVVIPRCDDVSFGILSSRIHVAWALAVGSSLEDRPVYTTSRCFEPFPFPAGLTPADTAHQRTEALEGGAVIPADLSEEDQPLAPVQYAQTATKSVATVEPIQSSRRRANREGGWAAEGSAQVKEEPAQRAGDTEQGPLPLSRPQRASTSPGVRQNAIAIAQAAKRLNDLRNNWLNPPEWTHRVPEVIPLGMSTSPYPDRIEPRPGLDEADFKALQKRTLTNLYNQRPAWLAMAHQQLDAAVAAAYGWTDYSLDMPDDAILKRLLALNLERSATIQPQ